MSIISKNTVGVRLLRYVFGCYFVVTLIVTATQLMLEYVHTKDNTFHELSNIGETIEDNLTHSVWSYDIEQLKSVLSGISKIDFVSGTRVTTPEGDELASTFDVSMIDSDVSTIKTYGRYGAGSINEFQIEQNNESTRVFEYKAPITYLNEAQGLYETIGYSYIYASRSSVVEKLKYSFILIIINSLLKTMALWFLFLFFVENIVAKPLRIFAEAANDMDVTSSESITHSNKINQVLDYKRNDEIQVLAHSFKIMQESVIEGIETIESQNATLEQRVEERTREIEEANNQLKHNSLHDSLTSLPNRSFYDKELELLLAQAQVDTDQFAVASVDLRKFKAINDTYGHQMGDAVLCEVASRMNDVIEACDTIARMGGDEFAIILRNADADIATSIGEKLIACTHQPITFEQQSVYASLNIGFAFYPCDGLNADSLYKKADMAMYQAKRNEHGLALYTAAVHKDSERKEILVGELTNTEFQNQLELHYQPIVNARDRTVKGFEALVRWDHPDFGCISPDEFIPIAENTQAIKTLTEWVSRQALKDVKSLLDSNYDVSISINVSGRLINDTSFPDTISSIATESGVSAKRIILEITESNAMSNPEQTLAVLERLKHIGFRLSIDDFGTGYSSFSYLTRLPVDELKIDRSFLSNFNNNNNLVVESIIDVAHRLNLKVVAEGVENENIMGILETLNCDFLQGHYFSHPIAIKELKQWMDENTAYRMDEERPRKFG